VRVAISAGLIKKNLAADQLGKLRGASHRFAALAVLALGPVLRLLAAARSDGGVLDVATERGA
jgi:hypothetical protein